MLLELDSKSYSLQADDDAAADEELDLLCQPLNLFVSLSDIDAQITPLKGAVARAKGLQTIFEGVFLETPPRSGGRTVIPRRKCDSPSSSLSDDNYDEDGEEDENFEQLLMQPLADVSAEMIVTRRKTTTIANNKEQQQLVVTTSMISTTTTGGRGDSSTITSSFCNSFQRRLNLIPGEE